MTRQLFVFGRISKCVITLLSCLLLLSHAEAKVAEPHSQNVNNLTPTELTRVDTRYALVSSEYSSGFIAIPEALALETAPEFIAEGQTFSLNPNFNQHDRYWLYAQVINHTNNADWALHVSNFGFEQVNILLRGSDDQHLQTLQNSGSATDINTIGRAIELKLQPGKPYLLIIELKATHVVWPPYIALMSDPLYQTWKMQMDYAFKLAIGIIIGMALLAFICWLLMAERVFFWGGLSSLLMLFYYLEHSSIPAIFWQSSYEKTFLFWALMSATLLSLLAFASSFLQISKASGRWYQIFTGTTLITISILIISTLLSFKSKSLLYVFNYALVWGVILSSGIAKVRSDGRYYVIYILGWLPLVLSILQVIVTLHYPKNAHQTVTVSYKLIEVHYVQVLHILIHAVALILRVRTLREDKLQAESISQAKSRFIAQSSHDLRQPLNSMNIFLDYLQPHIQGPEGDRVFNQLKKTRQQMSESFSTIMDLSKLEAGAILPDIKKVAIASLFSKIQNEYQMLAAGKNIQLNIHSSSLTILSDPLLLERLLRNLVSNAIKYTHSGRVVIGCRRRGKQVVIQVSDTGCGIDEGDQQHIFDIYHRSMLNPKQTEGYGIGLSIVKHIADLLGHPLSMHSVLGKGSSFTLTVPRVEKLAPNQQDLAFPDESAAVVALIFQDNDLRHTIASHLKKWHCSIQNFHSIDEVCQFNATQENTAPTNKALTDTSVNILLCEYSMLSTTSMPQKEIQKLTKHYVTACVCDPDTPPPKNWIAVSASAAPPQLRALLNVALRRSQANIKYNFQSEP